MNTLTKEIALDSMVLLKNTDQLLPLSLGAKVSLFGRAQVSPYYSGNGSGAARSDEPLVTPLDAIKNGSGFTVCPELASFYEKSWADELASKPQMDFSAFKQMVNSGLMYEIFGKYNPPEKEYTVPEHILAAAKEYSNTAVLFIGRNSGGEECDRHLTDDYYLTAEEKLLVSQVCKTFENIILVLNLNGIIDLTWIEQYAGIKSIIFMGLPGEGGGEALADILSGKTNPSGKLSFTIARDYKDYASADYFSFDKDHDDIKTYDDYGIEPPEVSYAHKHNTIQFAKRPVTVYHEGIFNGYRWFDAQSITPLFPFGHGLSYTSFSVEPAGNQQLQYSIKVTNTGRTSGKTAVLLYACPQNAADHDVPVKILAGFEKTRLLKPGECDTVTITIDQKDLAFYHEDSSTWELQSEPYTLLAGCDSTSLIPWGTWKCTAGEIIEECTTACAMNREDNAPVQVTDETYVPQNIKNTVASLTDEQLAALCVGWGPGIPFAALSDTEYPDTITDEEGNPVTVNTHPAGTKGYVSPAIPEKGIYSQLYKDGPASVGKTVWPTETIAACSFNRSLLFSFGEAIAEECREQQINVWLAPALNLHRNPLCGRNFEYYSEDPVLAGELAVALIQGAQKCGKVITCPKHFAANEQETYRRGSSRKNYDAVDSIISERALREVYLKPFEKVVRKADVHCIMSSFNKINGTFAGGNPWLLTQILRNEWGFRGIVVTDWGDMDIVVDGADGVSAGNDVIMPGGVPVITQILAGLSEGRVTRTQLETAVTRLLYTVELTR